VCAMLNTFETRILQKGRHYTDAPEGNFFVHLQKA